MEQFSNFSVALLNGAITNSQTSLTVDNVSKFPTSGTFRIIIDNEVIQVNSVSGSTFTVTRGQEGTTAAAHSNGAQVTLVVTNQTMQNFRGDNVMSFSFATLSSNFGFGKLGRVYSPTDAPYLIEDLGSAYRYNGPFQVSKPPNNGDFSWVNQGSATVVTTNGAIYLEDPASASGGLRIRTKTQPSTPYSVNMGFYHLRAS